MRIRAWSPDGALPICVRVLVLFAPHPPRLGNYQHEHPRRWSESVAAADAFALVTPEYNFGPTPALLNALNYVYTEWNYKPAAFVRYVGFSGGLRAVPLTPPSPCTQTLVPHL